MKRAEMIPNLRHVGNKPLDITRQNAGSSPSAVHELLKLKIAGKMKRSGLGLAPRDGSNREQVGMFGNKLQSLKMSKLKFRKFAW